MTIHFPRRHCVKKIFLLTDVTVNNCAWNYIISLNEKNLYIGRKTMQTMRVYFVYTTIDVARIDDGDGMQATFQCNSAKWQNCMILVDYGLTATSFFEQRG